MKTILLQQKKSFTILLILLSILSVFSCRKDQSNDSGNSGNDIPDFVTKVTSSVSGFVTNENNAPVEGAQVSAGGINASTDKYGYFQISNVQVVKAAATVTVTRTGYFKSTKTYIADDNRSVFFRIKLLPKNIAGNIDAGSGGNVTITGGMNIALPSNAVVTATGGTAYTGPVTVSASWINPVAADLDQVMPGDLRGINAAGNFKKLTSFGMVAVELTGSGGQLLQIASGKTATLTFPIPSSIASTAPTSIPLWSFDESKGLWKEEGTATKTGNTYVGTVSHFSFWNCDVPNSYVQLDLTLHNADGTAIPYAVVKVTDFGSTNGSSNGYTDSSGYVRGAVPANAQLKIEVFGNYNCNTALYSQNISTANANISLGTIVINSSTTATVTGNLVDCNNNAVTNGNVIVQEGSQYTRYPVNANGTFSFTKMLCSGTSNVLLMAEDLNNTAQGIPVARTISAGANNAGTLQACGVSVAEFLTWSLDGAQTSVITRPTDSLLQGSAGAGANAFLVMGTSVITFNMFLQMQVDATGIGVGSTQALQYIALTDLASQAVTVLNNPVVHITEYGPIGGFVAGNYNVSLFDIPTATTHTLTCSFRVRRNF
ncbi:MAG: carboxypeptidase regulatory-like domain-containing protein [Ferruginibacter sp.]